MYLMRRVFRYVMCNCIRYSVHLSEHGRVSVCGSAHSHLVKADCQERKCLPQLLAYNSLFPFTSISYGKKCICIDEKVNTPHFTDFQDFSRYICLKLKIIVLEGPAIFENLSYIFILMDYLNDQIMNIIISKLNCKRGPHYFREVLPVRSICLSIPRCKLSKFSNCQITLLHFKFKVHFPFNYWITTLNHILKIE